MSAAAGETIEKILSVIPNAIPAMSVVPPRPAETPLIACLVSSASAKMAPAYWSGLGR
jgi:hypothetical protein